MRYNLIYFNINKYFTISSNFKTPFKEKKSFICNLNIDDD